MGKSFLAFKNSKQKLIQSILIFHFNLIKFRHILHDLSNILRTYTVSVFAGYFVLFDLQHNLCCCKNHILHKEKQHKPYKT